MKLGKWLKPLYSMDYVCIHLDDVEMPEVTVSEIRSKKKTCNLKVNNAMISCDTMHVWLELPNGDD